MHKTSLNRSLFQFILAFIAGLTIISCDGFLSKKKNNGRSSEVRRDLKEIVDSGVLRVITTYSPTGYFIYRGEVMGFEYEIFKKLSEHMGVRLEMVLANNVDSVIPMLHRGEGDIIAVDFTITTDRKEEVSFTDPYLITHQSLIQKKPQGWRQMTVDRIKDNLATDVVDLLGDTVSVRKNSSYYKRLAELSNELGDSIYIDILPGELTDEEIIKMVALGEIKYSVIDHHKAKIHKSYFPDIDVNTPVSLSQRIAWAVRKSSPDLLSNINEGLKMIKSKPDYNVIYKKYFENKRSFNRRLDSEFYTANTGKFSQYDLVVKKYAREIGWDWILIKSIIFQESMFKNENQSWTGATGLMQLMPATASELGVTNISDPEENIRAGSQYLKKMYDSWGQVADTVQRVKFALASYNCGLGHVKDAQKLAAKYGKDSLQWDNGVDYFIQNLSKPKYYNDPVVTFGYARGSEPYQYVIDIFDRYQNYRAAILQ